jgi:hypothetical protein
MKANALLQYLLMIQKDGHDLSKIYVNYRDDYDSDVIQINDVCEDLYDAETNSRLISICLVNNINE